MDSDSESSAREEETFPGMCITGDGNDVKVGVMVNLFCCPDHCPATRGGGMTGRKIKNAVSHVDRHGNTDQHKNKAGLDFPTRINQANGQKKQKTRPSGSNAHSESRSPIPDSPTTSGSDTAIEQERSKTMTLLLKGFGFRGLFEIERGCGLNEALGLVKERLKELRGDQGDETPVLSTWDGCVVDEEVWDARDKGGKMTVCLM